ncbi:MAG: VCBS repeat-containing protein [Bacteroidales bacterium]|nr:VCBS repeat-containing protein [Bacteroidales bacterium]
MKKLTLLFLSIILLAFTLGDSKSTYHVPRNPESIFSCDIDLDGDIDIQIGHIYSSQTGWGGFTFLQNDSLGYFNLTDSLYTYDNQNIIYCMNILGDEIPEILGRHWDGQQSNIAIVELNNGNYEISYYPVSNNLTDFIWGDVSGNNAFDIPFISNNNFLWGILYNDGTGNFFTPEYFDLTFPPIDMACADLNNDGRADVVVCGSDTEIYFSTETGFQQLVLTTTLSHDVLISDFDNDGDNDVITHTTFVYPNHRVYMFENLGNNQFYEHDYFQFSPFCSYAQIADFNNDSLPDIVFIANDHTGLYIYYNKGEFQLEFDQFLGIDNLSPRGLSCNDFDDNGFNDIVASYGIGQPNHYIKILFNNGEGGFQENPITKIKNQKSL